MNNEPVAWTACLDCGKKVTNDSIHTCSPQLKTLKDEKQHFRKLAEIGCILCWHLGYDGTPAEIHHIRRGGIRNKSPVIPLCTEHHRGNTGIHGLGRKGFERKYEVTEETLLQIAEQILEIGRER